MDLLRVIIAIVLPPLGVFLQVGFHFHLLLNVLLTLLGWFPGQIHAVYVIGKYDVAPGYRASQLHRARA